MSGWQSRWLALMAEAAARRTRVERGDLGGKTVPERALVVERATLPASRPQTEAPRVSVTARRAGPVIPWRSMLDGFELMLFALPRSSKVFVPPHLYEATDRTWRRWEVP